MDNVHTDVVRRISWSNEKNRLVRQRYGGAVCFEDIVAAIEGNGLIDDIEHPDTQNYPHQRMYVVLLNSCVYAVPYVEEANGVFLKTVFPSRRWKAIYFPEVDNE